MGQTCKKFVGEEEGEGRAFRPGSRSDTCGRKEARQEVWISESQKAESTKCKLGSLGGQADPEGGASCVCQAALLEVGAACPCSQGCKTHPGN